MGGCLSSGDAAESSELKLKLRSVSFFFQSVTEGLLFLPLAVILFLKFERREMKAPSTIQRPGIGSFALETNTQTSAAAKHKVSPFFILQIYRAKAS